MTSVLMKLRQAYGSGGLSGICKSVYYKFFPMRLAFAEPCLALVNGKKGLEIGGPSELFNSALLPIYGRVSALDNCNFSDRTVWEGNLTAGQTFKFHPSKEPGRQYILGGADLSSIPDGSYDFLLSCHTLEHLANPLGALAQWKRIIRPGGALVLALPHYQATFDHRRPVTSIEHLRADRDARRGEDDLTHLEEACRLHDIARDPGVSSMEEFRQRAENNIENRCLHHHVFDSLLVAQVLNEAGFQIAGVQAAQPMHIIALAIVPPPGARIDNGTYLRSDADYLKQSIFEADRRS